jgi:hypothetical protein
MISMDQHGENQVLVEKLIMGAIRGSQQIISAQMIITL